MASGTRVLLLLTTMVVVVSFHGSEGWWFFDKIGDAIKKIKEFVVGGDGWKVIQRRMDDKVDFDREWKDYKKGFGKVKGDFWIGNEKLHKLTEGSGKRQELRIDLIDWDSEKRWAKYDDFKVGSEESGYKLISVGKYSGDAGDELTQLVGKKFSTKDKNSAKCAKKMKAGWWFGDDCASSCLNGEYLPKGADTKKPGGVVWKKWKEHSLKFAKMMIREYKK